MAEHDYDIANQTGAAFRSDLNLALAAIVSQNSKTTAPTTTFAYMTWIDTTNGLVKMRNGSNTAWLTLGTVADYLGFGTMRSVDSPCPVANGGTGSTTAAAARAALSVPALTGDESIAGAKAFTGNSTFDNGIGQGVVQNGSFDATVSGNALTISLKTNAGNDPSSADPVIVTFRSVTLTTPGFTAIKVTSALSLVISSGSTLGFTASELGRIYIGLMNNGGAVEICAWKGGDGFSGNLAYMGNNHYQDCLLVTTLAEGGAGGADNATKAYSTSARTSVPLIRYAYIDITTGATAGQWGNAPALKHLIGPRTPKPGQILQETGVFDNSLVSTATIVPLDTSIPTSTEGGLFLSGSIVPKSAANIIDVEVVLHLSNTAAVTLIAALFKGGSASAFECTMESVGAGQMAVLTIKTRFVAAQTSSISLIARAGGHAAGTTRMNMIGNGTDGLGGTVYSRLIARELMV